MAFGRGGLYGEGLGNSVQKMEYLPEAHTDFVFAILGEELGFIGVCAVILLEMWLVWRLFIISKRFLKASELFSGYVSFGVGLMIAIQTVINIGAASGMLPTKGLTLPLISYGGSSMMMMLMALALVLRLDYEFRLKRQHIETK
jgi:cell division protein FtsW